MESIAEYRNSQKSENKVSIESSSQLAKYRAQQFCRCVRKNVKIRTRTIRNRGLLKYILCEQIPLKIIVHLFLIIPSKNLINHKYKLRQMKGLHPYRQCQFSLFFFLMHFVSFLGLDFPKNIFSFPGSSDCPQRPSRP